MTNIPFRQSITMVHLSHFGDHGIAIAEQGINWCLFPLNESGRPQGYYEDFLTGFLIDPSRPTTWGRPVGVLVLPDESLLFTEEANNRIYRVQYQSP